MNRTLCHLLGALYVKRVPNICCSQICKISTDSSKLVRMKRIPANPGIENRLDILKMESPEFEKLEPEKIDLEDLESDFMEVDKMHEEYEREKRVAADKLAYEITKKKHFKPPKLPNLLMWTEKEQIRHLHQLDSIEWSPEKLSENFPATPEIIKKLLKSRWKPKSESDITHHDRSVQRNWSALMKGKYNLDPELKRHFLSFSSRQLNYPQATEPVREEVVIYNRPLGSHEFSDIVKNFSKDNSTSVDNSLEMSIADLAPPKLNRKSADPRADSFVMPSKFRSGKELLPLKQYKEKVLRLANEEGEGDELSRRYYDHLKKGIVEKKEGELSVVEGLQVEESPPSRTNKWPIEKRAKGETAFTPKMLEVYMKAEQYKMKIKIPEEEIDPSAVYKVKDCFYDADGKFLYRVPGLT
ncbi:uncharacterized protein LOC124166852 isoform X2 [Ischnura elegans]|nr:uncharacterized protein LOC124166852 isoform X2 [Ischnura elegans]XP_046400517.1 uncharacterized protein LOC124166852 isoform X2 [Ischnura elegans]